MQRKWYRSVLEKDIDAVNGLTGKKEGKTRLMNMVMQVYIATFDLLSLYSVRTYSFAKSPAIHIYSTAPSQGHPIQQTNILFRIRER